MPSSIVGTINQISQLGIEVTPGTAVAATKRLASMGLPMTPAQNIQSFQPTGAKFSTAHALSQEWSEGSISDDSGLAYNEIQYVLASLLSKPSAPSTVTAPSRVNSTPIAVGDVYKPATPNAHVYRCTVAGTTNATPPTFPTTTGTTFADGTATMQEAGVDTGVGYLWTFDIATYSRDTVQTYTIETGDALSGRSYRASNCFFTGMELESSRSDTVSLSGDLLGSARSSFALTSIGSTPDLVPATPAHLNVYMDNTAAALGTTQLDGNFTTNIAIADRAGHTWFHGRQYSGPAGRVETMPESTFTLTQADGTEVDTMLLGLTNSLRKFFRIEFVGPEIVPGVKNKIMWDIAGNIGDSIEYDDNDGVVAVSVPFAAEHDGTWGKAMRVTVVNGASAL